MSQRVDTDEQRGYQAPTGFHDIPYQGRQPYPGVLVVPPGPMVVPPKPGECVSSRHRLILALFSLLVLVIALIAFASVLETWTASAMGTFALMGLGLVCLTLIGINAVFNLRR
jgi:hypothetical protein